MRIGAISDIHANLVALQKALDFFGSKDVDTILCAGDLVDGEPDGDAVVNLLQTLSIPCVRGNHDEASRSYQAWLRRSFAHNEAAIKAELLADATLAYLDSLPLTLSFTFGKTRLLLAHGILEDNTAYLFPNSSLEQFEQLTLQAKTDVVILGHTHVPMCRHVNQTWIVNPGSLDGNRNEQHATFALLELEPFSAYIFDLSSLKVVRTCG